MRKWVSFVVVPGTAFLVAASATAATREVDQGFERCVSCINALKGQLAHVTLWGNVWMIAGAIVAGLGSLVAGLSPSGKRSWIAGIVGAVGAAATALPKTLPDRAEIQKRISAADQHRVRGEKTMRQLALLSDPGVLGQCERYSVARFVDCSAEEPPKDVPEIPSSGAVASVGIPSRSTAGNAHGLDYPLPSPSPSPVPAPAPAAAYPQAAATPSRPAWPVKARPVRVRGSPSDAAKPALGF